MKERHLAIGHIVGGQAEPRSHPLACRSRSPIRQSHRFWCARRSAGEDQDRSRLGVRQWAIKWFGNLTGEQPVVRRALDIKGRHIGGQQRGMGLTGYHELAVGMGGVHHKFGTTPSWIEADGGGTRQRRGANPQQVLGNILQQQAEMGRLRGVE